LRFCQWLADTSGSQALIGSLYLYPLIETAHVLTLCLFVGLAAILDLRLMGLAMRTVPVSRIIARYMPFLKLGFAVMFATGLLLFYAIPVRSYQSVWFRLKVIMLILAGLNAWLFHARPYQTVQLWDADPVPPRAARLAGGLSLFFWACVIVSGRFIAYSWFDCPNALVHSTQPPFVIWAAGCADEPAPLGGN
jgi:uncharacterized membrane protein